jgi:hypothetical protein
MPAATVSAPTSLRMADIMLHGMKRSLAYGELLLKDIPADKFAHMPHPTLNHPAFIIGHLSIYPNRLFTMLGRKELVKEKAGYPELFQAGVACVEQDGRYPKKDEIVAYYVERYTAIGNLLPTLDDEVFSRENPMEGRIKEMFPQLGLAFNFMLNNHHMMHLGQVSAWRRCIGLGSAM